MSRYFDWPASLKRFVRFASARAEEVNDALDELSAGMDMLDADIDRTIKLQAGSAGQELDLAPGQRAHKLLAFDAAGNITAVAGGGRYRGDWATATLYVVSDYFRDPASKNIYSVIMAHTSVVLADDIAAGRVLLAVNVADSEAAKDVAVASAAAAVVSAAEAASSAGDASASATVAVDAATTAAAKAAQAGASEAASALSQDAAQASAAAASIDAQRAETAAGSISGGPVTSVGGATGVVLLKSLNGTNLTGAGNIVIDSSIYRSARTSNTALTASDKGKLLDITSGTFTQTFAAASALGDGWFCYLRNSGTGDITLDPNGAEQIDGLASYVMYPGEVRLVQCDGGGLRTVVLTPFHVTLTTSGNFIEPPGYALLEGLLWGAGGASGGASTMGGGGGGACTPMQFRAKAPGTAWPVVIGAPGIPNPETISTPGTAGGTSTALGYSTFGGAAGTHDSVGGRGGGGGGVLSQGVATSGGYPVGGNAALKDSTYGGGAGAYYDNATYPVGHSIYGGGGGGGVGSGGGNSHYGGGGGSTPARLTGTFGIRGPDGDLSRPLFLTTGQSVRGGRGAQNGALMAGFSVGGYSTNQLVFGNVPNQLVGTVNGDLLVAVLCSAANNNEIPTIMGWTQLGTVSGGLGAGTGDGSGLRRTTVLTRTMDGSETTVTANLSSGVVLWGHVFAFKKNSAAPSIELELGSGTDAVTGTALSIVTAPMSLAAGDLLLGYGVLNTNLAVASGLSFSSSGLVLDLVHAMHQKDSPRTFTAAALVGAGSNGAVTLSGVLPEGSGNQNTGSGVVLRIRGAQDVALSKMAQAPGGGGCGMLPGARGEFQVWGVM